MLLFDVFGSIEVWWPIRTPIATICHWVWSSSKETGNNYTLKEVKDLVYAAPVIHGRRILTATYS